MKNIWGGKYLLQWVPMPIQFFPLTFLTSIFIIALPSRAGVTVPPAFSGMSFWGIVMVLVFIILFPASGLVSVWRSAWGSAHTPGTWMFLSFVGMFVFFGWHIAITVICRADVLVLFMLLGRGRSWPASPFISSGAFAVAPTRRGSLIGNKTNNSLLGIQTNEKFRSLPNKCKHFFLASKTFLTFLCFLI